MGVKYAVFPCCHRGFKLLSQALKNHPAIDKSPKIKVGGGRVLNLIVISVFVAVLTGNPKSPISERLAITGALSAYYQVIVTN